MGWSEKLGISVSPVRLFNALRVAKGLPSLGILLCRRPRLRWKIPTVATGLTHELLALIIVASVVAVPHGLGATFHTIIGSGNPVLLIGMTAAVGMRVMDEERCLVRHCEAPEVFP